MMDFPYALCFDHGMVPDGRVLKAARVLLDLTPEQVAREAGITRVSLSRVETGSRAVSQKMAATVWEVLEKHGVRFISDRGSYGISVRRISADIPNPTE